MMTFLRKGAFLWLPVVVLVLAALPVLKIGRSERDRAAIYYAEGKPRQVALTFSTLWSNRGVEEILDILDSEGVKATFFISGTWLERHPESAGAILVKGHEIGNRAYTDLPLLYVDEHTLTAEIGGFNRTAEKILEYRPRLFRPPRGEYSALIRQAALQEGCSTVLWTVDSYDWFDGDASVSATRLPDKIRGGAIVSFRVGTPPLPEILPAVIKALREQGYELVTVTRLQQQ